MKKLCIALSVIAIALAGSGVGSADGAAETTITGAPVIKINEPGNLEFRGTLTTADGPVVGATLIFRVPDPAGPDGLLCTAETDENGVAACEDVTKIPVAARANFYDIHFEGSEGLAPTRTRAGLVGMS